MRKTFQGTGGKQSKTTVGGTHQRQVSVFSSFLISDSFVGSHDIIFKPTTQTQSRNGEESPFFWAPEEENQKSHFGGKTTIVLQ